VVDPPTPASPSPVREGGEVLGPTISFHNVTFAYTGGRGDTLRGLNLEIPAGQIAAIVGPNGAGKSTLVKLLCRFYDPVEGSIQVDGVDLRSLALRELRAKLTVLFQEPVLYSATVTENITLEFGAEVKAEAEAAARAAGADALIERLPAGYKTVLGTWLEGGTDLSKGEWQRIALARAFIRHAPIIILDEPTSTMDSWAETDWLRRFRSLAAGRTTLIITHRFTTAMLADAIHVLEEGRIVESGSHAALLALGGRYAQSWHAQMNSQTFEVCETSKVGIEPTP
jgi:ATP-binding cassette subfamily B protein